MQVKSIFQWELQLTLLLTADYKADVTQVNCNMKEGCNQVIFVDCWLQVTCHVIKSDLKCEVIASSQVLFVLLWNHIS